jgi:hypothetical protein
MVKYIVIAIDQGMTIPRGTMGVKLFCTIKALKSTWLYEMIRIM